MIKNIRKISKYNNLVTTEYLDARLKGTKESLTEYLDVRLHETKDEIKDEIRVETAKILQGVDKIVTRFDIAEKDHVAHAMLHKRITDHLRYNEQRIKKLEAKI